MIKMPNRSLYFAIMLLICLLPAKHSLYAQADLTVRLSTPRVELIYHPPLRTSVNSPRSTKYDVARLNLLVNLLENYVQYLIKLQRIAAATRLRLIFAPEQSLDVFDDDLNRIRLRMPGLNEALIQVNDWLAKKPNTEASVLLHTTESLFQIPDNYSRTYSETAARIDLINHSSFQPSLEPDSEFAVINQNSVITARPFQNTNRLFLMTDKDDVCTSTVLLQSDNRWYSDLTPSNTGDYLAFTRGNEPMIMSFQTLEPIPLFSGKDVVMLSMEWSPTENKLSGLVLDSVSLSRHFFVYDAETNSFIDSLSKAPGFDADHVYAYPNWSPDGNRILLTIGGGLHLVDVSGKKIHSNILRLANNIAEVIWSPDSSSFALVEINGQARDKYIFDDLDFRQSVLRRYRINEDYSLLEDQAQKIESRHSIKPVAFWTLDRVLYLEGRLKSQRNRTPVWNLSKHFTARLTPPPSISIPRADSESIPETRPTILPLKYLYVFSTLDGQYKNIYDAGFGSGNQLYTDNCQNFWFIGLRTPDNIEPQLKSFNMRFQPYPFVRKNISIFSDMSETKLARFIQFLDEYNLREISFCGKNSRVFMLANFAGPLNLWSGYVKTIADILTQPRDAP